MLRIAKHQGLQVDPPPHEQWDAVAAMTLWKKLEKRPWQAPETALNVRSSRDGTRAVSRCVWDSLGASLIILKDALSTPALHNVAV